ncbi:oxidative damage protection protein [Reinekea sp.]|jgi:Fe-S cluster biosynthesis and repair protein YggX|uniref:oxidative damage protection protein n=1 Tax=Reinekea sp. TaxID=1970455 RepID=UPI003989E01C
MTRMVDCSKYKKPMPGLERPPFPGPKGLEIFETVSKDAWNEWQEHQTRLINEKQLTVTDPSARTYLMTQMTLFLTGQDYDAAEGYVPEED